MTDTSIYTYSLTGQTTGSIVDFQVTSFNANGESEKSDIVSFYVATTPATPAAPTETNIHLFDYALTSAAI